MKIKSKLVVKSVGHLFASLYAQGSLRHYYKVGSRHVASAKWPMHAYSLSTGFKPAQYGELFYEGRLIAGRHPILCRAGKRVPLTFFPLGVLRWGPFIGTPAKQVCELDSISKRLATRHNPFQIGVTHLTVLGEIDLRFSTLHEIVLMNGKRFPV